MTPTEAAELLDVNKMTVLRWIRTGRLAAERVMTAHGPGYEIKIEDLRQAAQAPRKKREAAPTPVKGSIVESIDALRKAVESQAIEIHDLRGQLAQTEARLTEALRALPAPAKLEEPRQARSWWPFNRKP